MGFIYVPITDGKASVYGRMPGSNDFALRKQETVNALFISSFQFGCLIPELQIIRIFRVTVIRLQYVSCSRSNCSGKFSPDAVAGCNEKVKDTR